MVNRQWPHPDRILPSTEPALGIAREIYAQTAALPLVCMHGHVEAGLFVQNVAFSDPAALLVVPDHYLTRMLVSQGIGLAELGIPPRDGGDYQRDGREIWRLVCAHWDLFRATPSRYWLEHELADLFDIRERLSAANADETYDQISTRLLEPAFLPMALFERFGIQLLATTDAATADLADHATLRARLGDVRVIPTFRPDALVHLQQPAWCNNVERLGALADVDTGAYDGFLAALRQRRLAFVAAGALATDHGHVTADTTPLSMEQARRIYDDGLAGSVSPADAEAFSAHMLFEMARMSVEDGLVMQLHAGVLRDHDRGLLARFGPDNGFDIPVSVAFTRGLRPLLEAFGHEQRLRLVLFTVDETAFSRELAPLAGAYPAVTLGAPWWFLDSPAAMRRFRESATETAGFYNTSGFVDDTRAFLSIPARHDLARRIDAGYLAELVAEHRLAEDEAIETAIDLAYRLPLRVYAPRTSGNE